jgi:uncharacterized membrane protein
MRLGASGLVIGALVWSAALFVAPLESSSSASIVSRSASLVYAAGAFVCHQRPERSFWLAGKPLPVCARCTGLYLSALAGGVLALTLSRRSPAATHPRWILAVACIPTAATWIGEFAGLIHPSNLTRAIAAVPLGAAAAWVVVALLTASGKPEAGSRKPEAGSGKREAESGSRPP